jgi:predicted RNase H-like nuclease
LGIDLAWGEGSQVKPANRSGVVALESDGRIVRAGWTIGVDETIEWIVANAVADTLLFVDAPLVIS